MPRLQLGIRQVECIREMVVDFAQGFLLHRTAPIGDIVKPVGSR